MIYPSPKDPGGGGRTPTTDFGQSLSANPLQPNFLFFTIFPKFVAKKRNNL